MKPIDWLLSRDTGVSSKAICRVLAGSVATGSWHDHDVPHDPDDFGRCHRLLRHFPAWRNRLHEVATLYPIWGPMVAAWDELDAMYLKISDANGFLCRGRDDDAATAMYERMQEVVDACRVADGMVRIGQGSWRSKA